MCPWYFELVVPSSRRMCNMNFKLAGVLLRVNKFIMRDIFIDTATRSFPRTQAIFVWKLEIQCSYLNSALFSVRFSWQFKFVRSKPSNGRFTSPAQNSVKTQVIYLKSGSKFHLINYRHISVIPAAAKSSKNSSMTNYTIISMRMVY